MSDVSGVSNLNSNSNGSTSLAGIQTAVGNLNTGKAEVSGQVFTGNISATNLSGTNTGDQTISDATISTTDVTTNNSSTSKHGFLKKLSNLATDFMNGQGAWASVKDSDLAVTDVTTNNVSTSAHGFVPKLPNDATKFLNGVGAFTVPNATAYKNGTFSKNAADASTTQTIAHGLGTTPKYVRLELSSISAIGGSSTTPLLFAKATYNGTTQASTSFYLIAGSGTMTALDTSFTLNAASSAQATVGVVTVDATNISIAWTKTGTPTGTYTGTWEAFG